MRISDWSSDVCASDLLQRGRREHLPRQPWPARNSLRDLLPGLRQFPSVATSASRCMALSGLGLACRTADRMYRPTIPRGLEVARRAGPPDLPLEVVAPLDQPASSPHLPYRQKKRTLSVHRSEK